jgi:hypothetical protein
MSDYTYHRRDGHALSPLYVATMRSARWADLRKMMRDTVNGWCEQRCGNMGAELHHRHYRTLSVERPEDVMWLCARCHDIEHRMRRGNNLIRAWLAFEYGQAWDRGNPPSAIPVHLVETFLNRAIADGGGLLPIYIDADRMGWSSVQVERLHELHNPRIDWAALSALPSARRGGAYYLRGNSAQLPPAVSVRRAVWLWPGDGVDLTGEASAA